MPAIQPAAASPALHPSLFREYDIRGIMEETLFTEDAAWIGRAFMAVLAEQSLGKRVCVAFDGRLSSPALEEALVRGLMSAGAEVIRVGLGPTPMLYFATKLLKADGGIMVTGSHNPPNHNGFKFLTSRGALYGKDIKFLEQAILTGGYPSGAGSVTFEDVSEEYVEKLAAACHEALAKRPLKVAWDAGNGATGEIMRRLAAQLPGTHILLNEKIDGTFPVHHPDPTIPKNLEQLIATVKQEGCDLGLAFDGDGDRLGAVDAEGTILWGDQLMVFFGRDVLKQHPGATIIADVKASQVLFDEIAKAGGKPLMWRTGHSLVKAKMAETGAKVAGEMSGHLFFADEYYGFDDGIYAAARLLRLTANASESLASMLKALPETFSTPEIRIDITEERKFKVVEEVKQRLQQAKANVNDVDGVRVLTKDGWWLLRASNTQAVLVARCEASSPEGKQRLLADLQAALASCNVAFIDGTHAH